MVSPELVLLPVRVEDEAVALAAHHDDRWGSFKFLLGYDPAGAWACHVDFLEQVRAGAPFGPGGVPATFLLAWVDGELVGRTSIRHELNEKLVVRGGHIGFGVLPEHRGQGHAAEILRQSLAVAHGVGISVALVTCDDSNVASASAIERCGGVLESDAVDEHGTLFRRYWVRCAPAR